MKIFFIPFHLLYIALAIENIFQFPQEHYYSDIIKVGQNHYDLIQQRSALPKYGECWKAAVLQLTEDCRSLTEEKQQDLSLSFTNCFLEMSGHTTYSCIGDKKPNLRRICISSMSDRAFNVYTEFYSHTQNMCFYLYNRIWHERAEETINLLNFNTIHVNKQLELSKELQTGLLEQQKQGIEIQNELIHQGKKLSTELEGSHIFVKSMAENFTSSTKEQTTLLLNIFSKISSFQRWALGEISWFSSTIYYIVYLVFILLISCTKTTENCRLPLLLVFFLNIAIEYVVTYNIAYIMESAEYSQIGINISKTIVRYICLFICFGILLNAVISYKDYNVDNNKLLIKLQQQFTSTINTIGKIQEAQNHMLLLIKQIEEKYNFKHKENDISGSVNYKPDLLKEINGKSFITNQISTRSKSKTPVQKNEFQDHIVKQVVTSSSNIKRRLKI